MLGGIAVGRLNMLTDTVTLFNYIGEINDEAVYQETTLAHCYCPLTEGANTDSHGKKSGDKTRLYIFDDKTVATASDGSPRTYLPYQEWAEATDKSSFWTLSDKGNDYIIKTGSTNRLRVCGFCRKETGSRRMWHFEVDAT